MGIISRHSLLLLSSLLLLTACSQHPPSTATTHQARKIEKTMVSYHKIDPDNWAPISTPVKLKPGDHDPIIAEIKRRLVLLGDMPRHDQSDHYNHSLEQAIQTFQWRHGLKANGKITSKTIRALNISPQQRQQQLKKNLAIWQQIPDHLGSHYIMVNIPNYDLNIIKDGQQVLNMKVIVGKPSRPTPVLYSHVKQIVFNPTWNVPKSLIRKDIAKKQIENPHYLAENNITIYKNWKKNAAVIDPNLINWHDIKKSGSDFRFTQSPGDQNALGRVKFIFLNKEDIYLHDTPEKELFKNLKRAYSSGCIRLEKPFQLAEYFLKQDPKWSQDKTLKTLQNNKTTYLKIKKPIPIYITYITAWVDNQGHAHFREDIYQQHNKRITP